MKQQQTLNQVQDYIALTKPRITFFCLIMTVCGALLVKGNISLFVLSMVLIGTALSVGSANAFNMIYEQDIDKLMGRTCLRPLASGRLKSLSATVFALSLGIVSIFVLAYFVNFLTAAIALFAIISYTLIYTPLKIKTPLALVIGAIPGAIAPVLGFTAVTNKITLGAFAVFGILFAWQMPHFIAISIYSKLDYQRAGFKVISVVRSAKATRIQAFLWTFVLLIVSMLIIPLKLAGTIYFVCASVLGIWFLVVSAQGLRNINDPKWPKKFFAVSLVYLPLLVLSVIIDRVFA
jgi:protoheme IX farnesyltransferase